jgi:thiol-disulfide isomerase/thioredoxin
MIRRVILVVTLAAGAWAQEPSVEEQQSLMSALSDGQTSPIDMIRALEAHVAKFPKSTQMGAIEQTLAKAAMDAGDLDRLVKYGEPLLEALPDDMLLLDRLSFALVNKEDKALAERAYKHARALEALLNRLKVAPGRDAARKQEDWEREMSRALLYQARARRIAGDLDDAVRLSARAFAANPSEEPAREWADNLHRTRKIDDAIARLAEAFVVIDPTTTEAARMTDRKLLGEWYKAKNGSEKGLGDVILAAYDRMSLLTDARRKKLDALEPNASLQSAMEFTLGGLDGKPFRMASLQGKIVVMDFWASWCLPCRDQHPLYGILKQRFPQSSGVVFLEINADEDRTVVEPFLDEQKWDKDVYYEDGLARLLNVRNIPATILFDKSGQLASRMDGFNPESFLEQMTDRINSMLAAK